MTGLTQRLPCSGCGRSFTGVLGLRAHQSGRFVAMACRRAQAAMPAKLNGMSPRPDGKLNTHERAVKANAALTSEQRSAAGKARAAQLHHPTTLARRLAKAWDGLGEDDRRTVRATLRAAGVMK